MLYLPGTSIRKSVRGEVGPSGPQLTLGVARPAGALRVTSGLSGRRTAPVELVMSRPDHASFATAAYIALDLSRVLECNW